MLSSLLADSHVSSTHDPRALSVELYEFMDLSGEEVLDITDLRLKRFAAGFLNAVTRCTDVIEYVGGKGASGNWVHPDFPGCYTASEETRVELEKAIKFFFEKDYKMGTDQMIIWFRKAANDMSGCTDYNVPSLCSSVEMKLEGLR